MSQKDQTFLSSYNASFIKELSGDQCYKVDDSSFTHWYNATEFPEVEIADAVAAMLKELGIISRRKEVEVVTYTIELHRIV